eukprot:CAMPEP_0198112512 /NCGR_PEP_ID=MMETSP1442-20131203/4361_1 /TAXON_ID= /ORGANISM="Craspedostauros australis, Strain CCMP3328" /LENGTH=38 /DNA_ID= /DNA_START= /DNA_END= /DNA_ORIENTATION=
MVSLPFIGHALLVPWGVPSTSSNQVGPTSTAKTTMVTL